MKCRQGLHTLPVLSIAGPEYSDDYRHYAV
jgi:hypothetical protein